MTLQSETTPMRRIAIALIPWIAVSAFAGERVDASLDAARDGQVQITAVRGEIRVLGWDEPRVAVEGTRDDSSEEFIFRRDGDTVVIEDQLKRQALRTGSGTDLTVRVPNASRMRVSVVSADLDARNLSGALRLNTVSGGITGENLGDDIEATTVSGRVQLETAATRLNVRSTSGRLLIDNGAPLVRGRLANVSGEISLTTPLDSECDVEVETVSGRVNLTLTDEVNAALNIIGGPSGRIRNELTDQAPTRPRYGPGERLEQSLGTGSGYVRVSTVSGPIRLSGS
jgi:DUF4097 and DUF4098 domain-containing protein YvlB